MMKFCCQNKCCKIVFILLVNFKPSATMTALKIGNISLQTTKTNKLSLSNCGVYSNKFIVGGEEAPKGSQPWIAAVLAYDRILCSATIINEWWVLTAAHIFDLHGTDPKVYSISVGSNDRLKGVSYTVVKVVKHAGYNLQSFKEKDIAVMKVNRVIKFNNNVRPICLPNESYQNEKSKTVVVSGWGFTQFNVPLSPQMLRSVTLNILPIEVCSKLYYEVNYKVFKSQICTHNKGQDACQGDSGGPAIEYINGKATLIGIVSYGVTCADKFPGVFTKVSYFINWIQKSMS